MKSFPHLFRGLVIFGLLSSVVRASAMQVAGMDIQERAHVAQSHLQLNGVGVRKAYFLEVYIASLYLTERAREPAAVLSAPGPKRFQMVMLLGASSQDFNKALVKGMRRNSTDDEYNRLQDRIAIFERIIDSYGAVKRGDVINMDFLPGKGTLVAVNGQAKSPPIAGDDFYGKLLEIFVGKEVNDQPLKQKLLGL